MSTCLKTRKLSYNKPHPKLNCVLASHSINGKHLTKLYNPTGILPVPFPECRAGKGTMPGEPGALEIQMLGASPCQVCESY